MPAETKNWSEMMEHVATIITDNWSGDMLADLYNQKLAQKGEKVEYEGDGVFTITKESPEEK